MTAADWLIATPCFIVLGVILLGLRVAGVLQQQRDAVRRVSMLAEEMSPDVLGDLFEEIDQWFDEVSGMEGEKQ